MAITIFDVNTKSERRQVVEDLKKVFLDLFRRVQEAEICIVCDFPAIGSGYGKTDYLIFINIPYYRGNFYSYKNKDGNWIYLNSLVIGIEKIEDDSIEIINNDSFVSNQAEFNFKEALDGEGYDFNQFAKDTIESQFNDCAFIYVIKSERCKSYNRNDYVFLSDKIYLNQIIEAACERTRIKDRTGVNNFKLSENESLSSMVNKLIEKANEINDYGILTKKKIDKITDQNIKTTQDIIEQQGHQLTIVSGKPGSGKTLTLLRVFYKIVTNRHRARLLTYNKLLVYDMNQCIRNLPNVRPTNSSIKTLHQFFYQIGKKLGVTAIMGEDRIDELMQVCTSRVNIALGHIENYHSENGKWPTDISNLEYYRTERADRPEVFQFYKYFMRLNALNEDVGNIKNSYLINRKIQLIRSSGSKAFIQDYPKALEMIYKALTKTEEFYHYYNIKDRRELLSKMTKLENQDGEITYEEYENVVNRSTGLAKWSNTIMIDEAQDCLRMEKAILIALRGAENLIVASGGRDQLIRNREETNWSVINGKQIPYFHPREGRTTYRQKRNVVEFINAFVRNYGLASEMNSMAESNGLGRVIIDCRNIGNEIPNDIVTQLSHAGEAYGCSPYESILMMLPEREYVSGITTSTLTVDENDNFETSVTNLQRKLLVDPCGLNVWAGYTDEKSKISTPGHNQTRFIFYESCRGMEAWSVLCMDIDSFFNFKRNSKDAEKYAASNSNLLSTPQQLQNKYGLLWCYMAFTRAIDTLYLKIKDIHCDFSKELLKIAEDCGDVVEVLYDDKGIYSQDEHSASENFWEDVKNR